jgi:hypothetical protein
VLVWNTMAITKIIIRLRAPSEAIADEGLARISPLMYQHVIKQLFGLLLLIQTFNLTPLLFDLSLLRIELALSLLRPYLLILQLIAHEVTTARPYCGADGGTRAGSTNCGADYCAGRATGKRADPRTFFTSAQRLPGTTGDRKQHHYCHSDSD